MSRTEDLLVKAIGRRVRELRAAKGWSQERLAEEAAMHRTYMWGIEQGLRNPSIRHLLRIVAALDIPLKLFFDGL